MRKGPLERLLDVVAFRKKVQRPRVRNRKRGRSYRPAILGGISERQKAPTTPRRQPRPRDTGIADAWVRWQRRVPGIAGPLGGHSGIVDSAEVIFGALQQRTTERYLRRRELGRNFPADPGPRGRRKPAPSASGSPPNKPPGVVSESTVARGTVRRPVPGAGAIPSALPESAPGPAAPGPGPQPKVITSGKSGAGTVPSRNPLPIPSGSPSPRTIPYPSSATKTAPRAQFLLGASPLTMPQPQPRVRPLRERQVSRQDARARLQSAPLTRLNSLGVPSFPTGGSDCTCTKPKKPRKPSCTNPVISKEVHGNVLTTKRRILCPQSKVK